MWAGALWLGRGSAGHRGHTTGSGLAADGVQPGTDRREVNLTSSRGLLSGDSGCAWGPVAGRVHLWLCLLTPMWVWDVSSDLRKGSTYVSQQRQDKSEVLRVKGKCGPASASPTTHVQNGLCLL